MELDKMLLDDFAEITHDKKEKLQDVTCYGTAVIQEGTEYVRLDAADSLTPATFAVAAHHGDRVMVMIKNHRATVIANITTPSMTLGILNVTDGIIVQGYLTTNEERTAYDDQNHYGLTFSAGGIGGYGGSGKYWYLTNAGDLYASSAEIVGNITAESGYLGSKTNGFKIDQYGIYSGNDKSGTGNGYIVLANGDFARTINGTPHADLRFAIGANFGVSSSGVLYASNVDISGTVKASLGEIGGFEIDSTSIHTKGVAVTVNADNSVGLSSSTFKRTIGGKERSNLKFAIGSNFGVDSTGKLYGSNIEVTGEINATSGTIGSGTNKIDIGAGSIHYLMTSLADTTHDGFYIGTDGIALGKGTFKVTNTGSFTATTGKIGPWDVNSTSIYRNSSTYGAANGLYFGTSGLSITDKFQVNSAGKLTATGADIGGTITATDGSIAGWQIGTSAIYRGSGVTATEAFDTAGVLYFGSSGLSLSNAFKVTSSGALTATGADITGVIKANSGTIGTGTNKITIGMDSDNTHAAIRYGMTKFGDTTNNGFYLGTDGIALGKGVFKVTNAGALTATGADISGTIKADLGEIGGFEIDSSSIHTKNTTSTTTTANAFYLSSSTFNRAIAGYTVNNLKIAIGDGFAIDSEGSILIGRWANLIIQNVASSTQLSGGYWINDYTYTNVGGLTGLVYKNSSGSITGRALELRSRSGSDLNIISINNISISGSRPTASWVNSIALPALHVGPSGTDGAICGMTMKTNSGYVGLCTYPTANNDNKLYVKYITNDNYNNRVNTTARASVDCNITGHADGDLALTGGTLTGAITLAGVNINLGTNSTASNDSGDIVWLYGNGTEKMRIWTDNVYTAKKGPNYRVYDASGTALYSGQLVITDGTGASGKWGINITGHADGDLALTGGSLTGNITFSNENYIIGKVPRKKASGGGWAYAAIRFVGNDDSMYAQFGTHGSDNTLSYIYIGSGTYDARNNLRIYPDGSAKIYTDLTVGGFSDDSSAKSVYLTNSFGSMRLHLSSAGNHGLYSDIKGGWLLYASKDGNSTDSNLYVPRTLYCSTGQIWANVASGEAKVNASNGTHRIYLYSHSDGRSGIYAYKADGTGYSVIAIANGATTGTFYGHASSDLALSGGTLSGTLTINGGPQSLIVQASDASERYIRVKNSVGNILLDVDASGNHGLYSSTKGGWLLYATKDANSTNSTLYIPRATSISGTLTGYDYSGSSHVMVGSAADSSHRVGYLYHQNGSTVRVYGQAGGSGYTTYTTLTGTSSSDIRLKEHIEDSKSNALNLIRQIEMKAFDWKPGWRDYIYQPIGMIADQIEKLDPRLVIGGGYDPDGEPCYKVIDDHYLACYLTKGVQELYDIINELKAEIKALKGAA